MIVERSSSRCGKARRPGMEPLPRTQWTAHGSIHGERERRTTESAIIGLGPLKFGAAVSASCLPITYGNRSDNGDDKPNNADQRVKEHAANRTERHQAQGNYASSARRNSWNLLVWSGHGNFMAAGGTNGNGITGKGVCLVANRASYCVRWH